MIRNALWRVRSLVQAISVGSLILGIGLAVVACASPEATRSSDGDLPATEAQADESVPTTSEPPSPVVSVESVAVTEPVSFGRVSVDSDGIGCED